MDKYQKGELLIRSKYEMVDDIVKIIIALHRGERAAADVLMEDLKVRSMHMEEEIQQDVLMFAEQIYFQYDYDPWHKVTSDVTRAADRLLEALGIYSC